MSLPLTRRQKEMLFILYNYIKSSGYPPSIEEMREELGVASNQSVIDLLGHLEKKRYIERKGGVARSVAILPAGYEALGKPFLVPFLGVSHAGAPVQSLEIEGEWLNLPGEVKRLNAEVYLLKVSGNSMINAGIDDGDIVLVKSQKEFSSGDIVLAEIEGKSTIKRFISEDKPPYLYLKPENPDYKIIIFTNSVVLKGKVVSVISDGQLKTTD